MSLLDEASELPDSQDRVKRTSWYCQLDQETKAEVDEFIQAFHAGKLDRKFPQICKAAEWLRNKVLERCDIVIGAKSVEDFMRARRPK